MTAFVVFFFFFLFLGPDAVTANGGLLFKWFMFCLCRTEQFLHSSNMYCTLDQPFSNSFVTLGLFLRFHSKTNFKICRIKSSQGVSFSLSCSLLYISCFRNLVLEVYLFHKYLNFISGRLFTFRLMRTLTTFFLFSSFFLLLFSFSFLYKYARVYKQKQAIF